MLSIRATIPLTMLLLSGCVVGPDHKTPEIQLPGKFAEAGKTSNGDISSVAWWTAFNDNRLNGYVSTGLAQNLTVMQAIERINQAQARDRGRRRRPAEPDWQWQPHDQRDQGQLP